MQVGNGLRPFPTIVNFNGGVLNYRDRKLQRLPGYDYTQDGKYFVTFCVKDKRCILGQVKNGFMELNKFGMIVYDCYLDLLNHYENCLPQDYIIMPNHVHCVIKIDNSKIKIPDNANDPFCRYGLSEMVRAWKSFSSKRINENYEDYFKWQKSFYDHIIRNEKELYAIKKYIKNNPGKWDEDRFFYE